jgi:hypothetical protein
MHKSKLLPRVQSLITAKMNYSKIVLKKLGNLDRMRGVYSAVGKYSDPFSESKEFGGASEAKAK